MAPSQEQTHEGAASRIFLSFSGDDREKARAVKAGLEGQGLPMWWDEDIEWGEDWVAQLQERLSNASAFVILCGAGGQRRWVRAELGYALRLHYERKPGLPILPLRLSGVVPDALPPFLSLFQAPLLGEPEDFQALAEVIRNALRPSSENDDGALPSYDPNLCPFPGLRSFKEDEARFFYGRQIETTEALQLLGRGTRDYTYRRWLLVEGPSGVGKSSLVKAGLVPAIRKGWLCSDSAYMDWRIAQMRPGAEPLVNLAEAVSRVQDRAKALSIPMILQRLETGDSRALALLLREPDQFPAGVGVLLVVDQLEEIFTLTTDAGKRASFDRLLARALADQGPLHLITTIRSDFMLGFGDLPELNRGINESIGRYYLRPVDKAGLKDIIYSPARLAGLRWGEPSLPERILRDAQAAGKAALPLLGHLLRLLWEKLDRSSHTLLVKVYDEELGGVGGALAKSAEQLIAKLRTQDKGAEERVRRLLLALINDGRGGRDTRRVLPLSTAIDALGGQQWRWVLDQLSGQPSPNDPKGSANPRLVLVDKEPGTQHEPQVEIAHEALLALDPEGRPYWPRLSKWVKDNRRNLERRDLLESLARDWEAKGKPRVTGLLSARELREFGNLHGARTPAPAFLQASRRRMWGGLGVAVVLVSVVAAATLHIREVMNSDLWKDRPQISTFFEVAKARWLGAVAPKLVQAPAGSFLMGSPEGEGDKDERPRHQVTFARPFWIGAYEVSFAEYDRFALATLRHWLDDEGWGRGDRPVIDVSWQDATAYAEWFSAETGESCRLPTEAEWEYAARAGTSTRYWWGDEVGQGRANCRGCGSQWENKQTAPVDAFKPNVTGLYNVHGNVWEWVEDCYGPYDQAPADGSAAECAGEDSARVLRGGSWIDGPVNARAAIRYRGGPVVPDHYVGFRVVCSPPIRGARVL